MKIKFWATLLPFLLCSSINAYTKEPPPLIVQLKWRHQFQFAGMYAALIKGYYKQEGLSVVLKQGGPLISPVNEVLLGRASIGVFDPNVIFRSPKENPLIILAAVMQSSPYVIVSLKDKNILKPADLIGKTVLAEQDQGWDIFKAILLKEGIKPELITIAPRKKDSEEVGEKKVDAVVTYGTSQPARLRSLGYDIRILRPVEYGIDFYGDVLFSTKKFAYNDIDRTDAFIRATLKGWEYALKHQDEMIEHILTLPGVKSRGLTKELLTEEAAELKKLIMPELVQVGNINLGRCQYMLNIYKELGVVKKDVTLEGAIYLPDEHTFLGKWLKNIIYISLLLAIITVGIILLNLQLRKKVAKKTKDLQREVDSRRTAEYIASQNELRLQLAIRSANIGLWEWDLKTGAVFLSKEWCDLLNFPGSRLPNNFDLFQLIHPEDIEHTKRQFVKSLNGQRPKNMHQVRVMNNDGTNMSVLLSFKILKDINKKAEKLFGVVININDIERRKAELLELSEELMQSNIELKKFAYITSHNLRGPVVNLKSLMQMLNKSELGTDNSVIIDKIEASVKRLDNTLSDLIDVVSHQKPESKKLVLLDFETELKDISLSIESQLIKVNALIVSDFKVKNMLYPKMFFESIILNLLTNAIKYRSESRRLVINISTEEDEENIILKVKDNGKGIDLSKNGDKIFGLYQRFHMDIEGKGIGLFIIKSHIESLNGSITVESELDKQTTFVIKFAKV